MHIGNHYKLREFLAWTRRDIYILIVLSVIPTVLFEVVGWKWLAIPWVPIALIGTAAAFIVGFKNTQTYNRLWEARQVFGSIVGSSRAWGIMVRDFIHAESETHRQLIYVHFAWLTALRYQLREPRTWENLNRSYNVEYRRRYKIPEHQTSLQDELKKYLTGDELKYILSKKNRATQLITLQSKKLKALHEAGKVENFEYVELEKRLAGFFEQQGKCDRIKNFPYPRQFASMNLFFVWLFVILLPFGLVSEFQKLGEDMVWLTIPFSIVVSWVFTSMEKVGEATENPFEGGANDIPITALCRTIEIDLRDMLDEKEIPEPLVATNNILL